MQQQQMQPPQLPPPPQSFQAQLPQVPQQQIVQPNLVLSSNLYKIDITKPIYTYNKSQNLNKKLKHYVELENVTLSPTFIEDVDYKIVSDKELKKQLFQYFIDQISQTYLKQQHVIGNKYTNPMDTNEIHQHITVWQGTELKLKEISNQFFVSFITKPFTFTKKPIYELISIMQANLWDNNEIRTFFNNKKLFINEYYSKQVVYKIKDIKFDLSPQSIMDQTTKKTFVEHYEEKYELLVEFPTQPLIEVEITDKNQQNQKKSIFILPELCTLVTEEQNFNEIELFRKYNLWNTEPHQLVEDIKKVVKILSNSDQFQDFAKIWNLKISVKPTKFEYQFLEPGLALTRNNQEARLIEFASAYGASHFDDTYRIAFQNGFQNIPKLENWLIINYSEDMSTVDEFINAVQGLNQQFQYGIVRPQQRIISTLTTDDWIKELFQVDNANYRFITVIVRPEVDTPSLYKKIKDGITVALGIPTSIIKTDTLQMFSFSQKQEVIANKAITQMAVKLGGSPWIVKNLPFSQKPGIVVGFNVLKNQLANKVVVSIACSTNRYFSRYYSNFQVLDIVNNDYDKLKQEISIAMSKLLDEAIAHFLELHKMQVEILIIYRDGYYLHNSPKEIEQINLMIANNYKNQNPTKYRVIFITCREQSKSPRFFIHDHYDQQGKDYIRNSGQGTIIQNNGMSDFFLMIKKEKIGCSRVNQVIIEYIDQELMKDVNCACDVQNLTYKLCYQNFNLSPLQSTCAPLSYAFKYSKFVSMLLPIKGEEQEQPNFEIIKSLSKKGQLFYL